MFTQFLVGRQDSVAGQSTMAEPGPGQQAEFVERDTQRFVDKWLTAADTENLIGFRHGDQYKFVQALFLCPGGHDTLFLPERWGSRSTNSAC